MKLLWLTWKDHKHPSRGGAEVVLRELSQRLVEDGHEVTLLTCGYEGAPARECINGVDVIRIGSNRYLHSAQALSYYIRKLRGNFDIVIEVVNTAPYFSVFFDKKARHFLFYHQLAREVWFYEAKAPVRQIGYYILEPLATRILSRAKVSTITVSDSTRADLIRYGFTKNKIQVIREGTEIKPVVDLKEVSKYSKPTLLSLGTVRAMKRTLDQVEAFEIAKKSIPELQLIIAGDVGDQYGKQVLERILVSSHAKDIRCLGKVSTTDKVKLMQKCHLTMQTAIKEGWGLTITEAASQGTPAVAYDVDGLRDSIQQRKTGLITEETPAALAKAIVTLLTDKKLYTSFQKAGWQRSRKLTFDASYKDFKGLTGLV